MIVFVPFIVFLLWLLLWDYVIFELPFFKKIKKLEERYKEHDDEDGG